MSGKNTANDETRSATPREKENRNSIEIGRSSAEGLRDTPEIARTIARGTRERMKLTMLARMVDTTKAVRGT